MDDFIQLKKNNIIKIGIKDEEGKDTGEMLIFDLEDIELPLRYQQMFEEHKKNESYVRNQFIIIDKREDKKGKKILSANEEEKLKIIKEFYIREIKALDLFLGEGKTEMLLKLMNRKPYLNMFEDIGEILEPLNKILEKNMKFTEERIKDKYKIEEGFILE